MKVFLNVSMIWLIFGKRWKTYPLFIDVHTTLQEFSASQASIPDKVKTFFIAFFLKSHPWS
jgi:hypothetical protein